MVQHPPRLLFFLLGLFLARANPALASEASVREHEGGARDTTRDSSIARRILDEVNGPVEPPHGLERLTGTIPGQLVTNGLEQALDPRVLRRFGGPGLDLEDLRAAVNGDLRAGGTPHLTLAAGLLAYGGVKQAEKLRLPHLKMGARGSGFGLTSNLKWIGGGFYLLPARAAGQAPARRVLLQLDGLDLPLLRRSRHFRLAQLEFEQVAQPGPSAVANTRAVHFHLPWVYRGMRIGMHTGMSVTTAGSQTTCVRSLAPSIVIQRLALGLDIRRIDLGRSAYLDTVIRGSIRPLRVETRIRQDPRHRRPAVHETRIAISNLMPWLGW